MSFGEGGSGQATTDSDLTLRWCRRVSAVRALPTPIPPSRPSSLWLQSAGELSAQLKSTYPNSLRSNSIRAR